MQTHPVSPAPRTDHRLPTAEEVTIEGLRALQRAVCRGGLVVDLRWADAKADDGELVSEYNSPSLATAGLPPRSASTSNASASSSASQRATTRSSRSRRSVYASYARLGRRSRSGREPLADRWSY